MIKLIKNKKANFLQQSVIHIIIIGLIFSLFFLATTNKANSRLVKQQILEKQIALLIDSGVPGMDFYILKSNLWGKVDSIRIDKNKVFVYVDGYTISNGYPFFTEYNIDVETIDKGFFIKIR